jgi:hypothetical protein
MSLRFSLSLDLSLTTLSTCIVTTLIINNNLIMAARSLTSVKVLEFTALLRILGFDFGGTSLWYYRNYDSLNLRVLDGEDAGSDNGTNHYDRHHKEV